MTKLRYPFGGGAAVRQPCAVCTGASYERSTEPAKQLPILGWRYSYNDERNPTGTALAWDDMGANHRLYAEGSGQHAPGGQYWRRMGSGADVGADAKACARRKKSHKRWKRGSNCSSIATRYSVWRQNGRPDYLAKRKGTCTNRIFWRRPTYAHREQVHSLLYVPAHRLTQNVVAV